MEDGLGLELGLGTEPMQNFQEQWVEDRATTFALANTQTLEGRSGIVVADYPFSIAGWFNSSEAVVHTAPFGIGKNTDNYNYIIIFASGDVRYAVLADGNYLTVQTAGGGRNDGNWHFVAGVSASSSSHKISVDGANFLVAGAGTATKSQDYFPVVGGRPGGGYPFNGTADEFMVFDLALSITDVQEMYNAGTGLRADRLVDGRDVLTSGETPVHAYNLSKHNPGNDVGRDLVRSGTPIDLTFYGSGSLVDARGILAGRTPQ